MKTLIVEDDFTSRVLLQALLASYGESHVAINGKEALKQIRDAEKADGIPEGKGVKIVMTTALGDPKNVMKAHYQVCNGYMVKPIDKGQLLELLKSFGLI